MDLEPNRSAVALPQELIDMIVDLSFDDRDTLKACSLVCKDWVQRSQQHIHIRFNFDPCIRRFTPRYTSEEVARYVKIIQVSPSHPADDTRLPEEWEFLLRFHHVEQAIICWDAMGPSPISLTPSFLAVFAHTTHLTICAGTVDELEPFYEFLFSFPMMTHLELESEINFGFESRRSYNLLVREDTMVPVDHPFYSRILEFASRLQHLKISIMGSQAAVKYLLPLLPAGHCSLKSLHLLKVSEAYLPHAATLFVRCAETLQSLEIPVEELCGGLAKVKRSSYDVLSAGEHGSLRPVVNYIPRFITYPVVQVSINCPVLAP